MGVRRLALATTVFLLAASSVSAATVANLKAESRRGQTFITFTETSPTATYDVFRNETPITSLAGLTPVARLESDSSVFRYTGERLVICDLCPPLPDDTGLLVWTPRANGTAYYAVRESNATTFAVVSLVETHLDVPGAVLVSEGLTTSGYSRRHRFFAWEDHATWRTQDWGYYGYRFDVYLPLVEKAGVTVRPPFPMTVGLHSAGELGYRPFGEIDGVMQGVFLYVRDNQYYRGIEDPYASNSIYQPYSYWFGYYDRVLERARPVTEERIVRYAKLLRDDPKWRIDGGRIYVSGASLGGWGMHLVAHYPDLFAAAQISLAPVMGTNTGDWSRYPDVKSTKVLSPGSSADGLTVYDAESLTFMSRRVALPPIVHAFNKDDQGVSASAYPGALSVLEQTKQPYAAEWRNGNHNQFVVANGAPTQPWDIYRFRKDGAYPAFGNAGNSDAFDVQEGARNIRLDWSSSLHSLGAGTSIVDTSQLFEMTLKSTALDTTADLTIRNAQYFRPPPGQDVTWHNRAANGQILQSGTATADAQGLVTVRLRIAAAGNRVAVACETCPVVLPPPAPPRNVRLVPTVP